MYVYGHNVYITIYISRQITTHTEGWNNTSLNMFFQVEPDKLHK